MSDRERWLQMLANDAPTQEVHYRRFVESMAFLSGFVTPGSIIGELGGTGPFTCLLQMAKPDWYYRSVRATDLREAFDEHGNIYDVLCCMEVIEHVQDVEPRNQKELATFTGSGIRNMMAEAFRILKPAGAMFLTTPNVCSLKNIDNLLNHRHPFFFEPHHRELSMHDVRTFAEEAGFVVEKMVTKNVWGYHGLANEKIDALRNMLRGIGSDLNHREDDIFCLLRKPR